MVELTKSSIIKSIVHVETGVGNICLGHSIQIFKRKGLYLFSNRLQYADDDVEVISIAKDVLRTKLG